jgi:hypothetical protein
MRGRGLEPDEIAAELAEINGTRCVPPLDAAELVKIAESTGRYAPGKADAGGPDDETLEALAGFEDGLWLKEWRGVGEHTTRDVLVALCRIAAEHGRKIPAGVRVKASVREIAEAAAVGSTRTAHKALLRARKMGLVRRDGTARGPERGALVLLTRIRETLSPQGDVIEGDNASVSLMRAPTSPRLRWSAPEHRGRLGKIRSHAVDLLERTGSMTLEAIAAELGHRRPRDTRRRTLGPLLEAGIVEECPAGYRLSESWREDLDRRRLEDAEIAAAEQQKTRHRLQQEGFRNAWKRGEVVSKDELERRRRTRDRCKILPEERHPSGTISELEPVPYVPDSWTLSGLIGSRVGTPRGPGVLWDHKAGEARVVLDTNPERWVPLAVEELTLEGVA